MMPPSASATVQCSQAPPQRAKAARRTSFENSRRWYIEDLQAMVTGATNPAARCTERPDFSASIWRQRRDVRQPCDDAPQTFDAGKTPVSENLRHCVSLEQV